MFSLAHFNWRNNSENWEYIKKLLKYVKNLVKWKSGAGQKLANVIEYGYCKKTIDAQSRSDCI